MIYFPSCEFWQEICLERILVYEISYFRSSSANVSPNLSAAFERPVFMINHGTGETLRTQSMSVSLEDGTPRSIPAPSTPVVLGKRRSEVAKSVKY